MQSELIAVLGETNRAIRGLVSRLSEKSVETGRATLSSSELKALSQKLARVAKLLEQVSPTRPKEHALQALLNEYVDNLTKLKAVLERAKDTLGKHRDRLRKDLEQLNSAKAWVEAFRTTNYS
jgi:DNA repair exonuclease SbcCD ATPase subunit